MASQRVVFWAVDLQADFLLPGGKLYVPGAEKIIPQVARLVIAAVDAGALLVSSGDSHPEGDPEFKVFPAHCVSGTTGARIIPEGLARNFCIVPNDSSSQLPKHILSFPQVIFEKQTLDVFDNPLAGVLVDQLGGEAEYLVFGVATEYCVRCAAKGLLDRGRKVALLGDAIAALDALAGRRTLDELQNLGARLTTTDEALAELGARTSSKTSRTAAAHPSQNK